MFAFPSHPMFVDPWSSHMRLPTQWDEFGVPWSGSDDPRSTRIRAPVHQTPQHTRPDAACTGAVPGSEEPARQQRIRRHPTADSVARVSRTHQHHYKPQPDSSTDNNSSGSCDLQPDTAEPMYVCCSPPPGAPAPRSRCKQQQQQQQQQQSCSGAPASSRSTAATASCIKSSTATDRGSGSGSASHSCPSAQSPAIPKLAGQQQQQQQQQRELKKAPTAPPTPHEAATVIQAAWRMSRLARHRPALRQLAAAAAQLHSTTAQLEAAKAEAAAAGTTITQKQYLELSEPVMKVLFTLDAVSCGAASELRVLRKRLTTAANKLLDDIQAAHKSALVAMAATQQQHQQQQQQQPKPAAEPLQQQEQQQPTKGNKYQRLRKLAGFY